MAKRVNSHHSNRRYDWKEPEILSFVEFNLLVRQQVKEIIQSQEHIQRLCNQFSSSGEIGSDECDYLLTALHSIRIAICTFYRLFEEPGSLPAIVKPLYYPLLAELFASEMLIEKITQIARSFRLPGRLVSNTMVKQHFTLIHNLGELLETCENIKLFAQHMLDQACFQLLRKIK
ncbi:hypothetical protein EPA93_46285 [Ktedonosporobacter rubrisoli]|uniref:DUF403 domain-containing protein n=1 Tax=Ktedonosporobacter rubrisoli TaxID=2509675 RepID=A0A4P6K4U0_KTERU|nr:hypothetical protein [Ktedonosporobacter rubrisoli]QBD82982.1 hypothetical protein EPA93_46285 [Ktedonosporobacter rubrisoli]